MNRRRWVPCTCILLTLALYLIPGVAQPGQLQRDGWLDARKGTSLYAEYDRLALMMSQLRDPIRDATYVAAQGMNAASPDDLHVSAQVIVNMLEGSDSPLFDESLEIPLFLSSGIRPVVDAFTFTDGWYDPDEATEREKKDLEEELARIQNLLSLGSLYSQQALNPDADLAEQKSSMFSAYQHLDGLVRVVHGLLLELGYDIWVTPFITIQEAIDSARDGATIYLTPTMYSESRSAAEEAATIYIEPGIYWETLEITKSITLDGSYLDTSSPYGGDTASGYESVVHPDPGKIGVHIHSDHPIQVTLSQLTVENAAYGLLIEGDARVTLSDLRVRDSQVGIAVSDSASVLVTNGLLRGNDVAIQLSGDAAVSVSESVIRECASLDGAIQLADAATLDMLDCEVSQNQGNGVLVRDQAELDLTEALVSGNGGDGIVLSGACTLTMNEVACNDNAGYGVHAVGSECAAPVGGNLAPFSGTILGSGNLIPSQNEPAGNHMGSVCPGDLLD